MVGHTMNRSCRAALLTAVVAGVLVAAGVLGKAHAATLTWNVPGDGAWDTTSLNWTGGSPDASKYVDGSVDSVTFNNTAGGTITIQGIGVTPVSTTVSATSGTYTFTGGGINGGSLSKSGGGALVLEGANSYTGATTVNAGSLLIVRRGTGSIASSSAINVIGGSLLLENFPAYGQGYDNSNDRIGNSTPVTLERGYFQVSGNAYGTGGMTTETIGTLTFTTSANTTLWDQYGNIILTAANLVRTGKATGLIRGDNLGVNGAAGTDPNYWAKFVLTSTASLNPIGTNTANTTTGITSPAVPNLKIVPWLLADNSRGGNGSSFATYDTGVGLRPVRNAESVQFSDLTLGVTDDYNVKDASGSNVTFAGSVVANSINLAPAADLTYNGAGFSLTSTSGGLALTRDNSNGYHYVALTGFAAITLGSDLNPEGIIQVTGTQLGIYSPINAGKNYGLTTGGASTLVIGGAQTYTGALTVNAGYLYLRGSGTQSGTTVNGGQLVLDNVAGAGALGSGSAPLTINAGGSLSVDNSWLSSTPTGNSPGWGGGTINLNDGGIIYLSGGGGSKFEFTNLVAVTGSGYIYQDSGGGSGNKTRIGDISMSAGALLTTYRANGSTSGFGMGAVTLNEASSAGNATLNVLSSYGDNAHATDIHYITGTGGIIKRGNGELWLGYDGYFVNAEGATASSYTGDTRIEEGKLRIGMTDMLPTSTTLYVNAGATFDLATGGHENWASNYNQRVAGLNDGSAGGGTVTADSGGQSSGGNLGARTLTLGGSGTYTFSGTISNNTSGSAATLALALTGGGTQVLTGANTYTGGTTVTNGSTLQLGNGTTRNGSIAGNVSVDGSSFLTFNNPLAQTYAGAISGSGTFAKNSAGQLVLSGANTFGGTMAVNTGELDLAGNTSTLLTVNTGATFSPGAVAGEVTVGGLAFSGASTYKWEVSGTGIDHIQVNGDLSVSGTPTLKLMNVDNTPPPISLAIIDYTGNLPASAAWTIDYSATSAGTVSHWTDGTGAWDNNANWDQQGWGGGTITYDTGNKKVMLNGVTASTTTPGATTDVIIAPAAGNAAATGPASPASIASLVIGDSSANSHSLTLQSGGPLSVTNAITVNPSGSLTATAAGLSAAQLTVAGAANLGSAISIPTINSSGTTTFSAGVTGTIPALNVTAGTTTIASGATPAVTTATVSGTATFTANGGTIGTLALQSGYAGTVTVGSGATVVAPLTLATGTLNLSGTLGAFTVTGGTVNSGAGGKAATVALPTTGATVYAPSGNELAVTQSLTQGPLTITASSTATPFKVGGANVVANIDKLVLTGGTVTMTVPGGPAVTGVNYFKITSDATSGLSNANVYTHAINPSGGSEIVNAIPFTGAGTNTLTSLTAKTYTASGGGAVTINNSIGSSNFGTNAIGTNLSGWSGVTPGGMLNVFSHFNYWGSTPAPVRTVILTGLTAGTWYDLRLYEKQWDTSTGRYFSAAYDVGNNASVESNSPTIDQNNPQNTPVLSALGIGQQSAWVNSFVYKTGIGETSISLAITNAGAGSYHFYGLSNQVVTNVGSGAINLPNTNIAATTTSALNMGAAAANDTLGGLSLSGVGTQLTLTGATSITFNGNVTGTGTASVLPGGPSLILAGSNIDATGASDVLTLPVMTLAAATVNINASGAGTVVFSGATTFSSLSPSPSLVISGGLLQVDATLGSAAVTVTGTGHLGGHGTISGPIIIAAGGSLAPGDSPGVLTVTGALTLNYGALLDFDLNTPNAAPGTGGNDLLVVGSTLTLNPGLTLNITPGIDFGKGLYHLISFGSLTDNSTGFQGWTGTDPSGNWGYAFSKTAGSIDVTVTLIPEPASLALLGVAVLFVGGRRRWSGQSTRA